MELILSFAGCLGSGHSERREGFGAPGESDEVVAEKTKVAIDAGLKVGAASILGALNCSHSDSRACLAMTEGCG